MSTATIVDVVGTPLDRVDGRLKVTGAATYPIDVTLPGSPMPFWWGAR